MAKTAEKTAVKTMTQAMTELRNSVPESMIASKTERIGSPSLGDVVRQGDIYLVCIDKVKGGKQTKDRQLAPGSTQGSRHILDGDVKVYTGVEYGKVNSVLVGPAFECVGDVTVTHPEHGDKILPAGTAWQCVYQQAFADEIRRVQD